MEELNIVKYIKKYDLEKAVNDFKLICKDDGERILLKYSQIDSNMGLPEVQECRGLILEKSTLKVLCLPFYKFFNSAEGHAVKIDWSTAKILEKLDGSLISLYYYNDKWHAATTGMIEGGGEVNNKLGTTFSTLFWDTVMENYNLDLGLLDKDNNYVFELTTPYNIVVKPHGKSSTTLLTIRNRVTLKEVSYETLTSVGVNLGLPVVKAYDINAMDFGVLVRTFKTMPWSEEGYVIVDAEHRRVKLKNPAYVAVHHTKNRTAEHAIMPVVKTNEVDEYIATFPDRKEEILRLQLNYNKLLTKLEATWSELEGFKPKNITKAEQKRFAIKVFEISTKRDVKMFSGLFFNLKDSKVENVSDYLFDYDDKRLYKLL